MSEDWFRLLSCNVSESAACYFPTSFAASRDSGPTPAIVHAHLRRCEARDLLKTITEVA